MSYPHLTLIVGGEERSVGSAGTLRLSDPADGSLLTTAPRAGRPEALEAAAAAEQGGAEWAALSALERSRIMRRAADIMRERADVAARVMSMEQGKPLAEARGEWLGSADLLSVVTPAGWSRVGNTLTTGSGATISVAYNAGTGTLSLTKASGNVTKAEFESVLEHVQYQNTSLSPTPPAPAAP